MAASLAISISISSSPIKPSFLKPRRISLPNQIKPFSPFKTHASLSSSPFLTALEAPAHQANRNGSDAMSSLLGHRIVFLGGEITDLMADCVLSQLLLLDAQDPTKDIRIYINSSGGSLSASMAIYDVIQMIKSPVSTIAVGKAASTAALILGSGSPGKRSAMPNARIMLHQPSGSASGDIRLVQYQAIELLHNKTNVMKIVSGFTGRPLSQVKKDLDREYYMGAAEAVEYGIIDAVLDEDKVIPIPDISERVKPVVDYSELIKQLRPEIPDDEIY